MNWASRATEVFLLLVALSHVARLAWRIDVSVQGWMVPVWMSIPAAFLCLLLAWGLMKERPGRRGTS